MTQDFKNQVVPKFLSESQWEFWEAALSEEEMTFWIRKFIRESSFETESLFVLFHEIVSRSRFSIENWFMSLKQIDQWLTQKNKLASLKDQLSYLDCCCLSKESQFMPLDQLTKEMLAFHGFERSKEARE
ncbi:MAG: hypothetical protein CL678_03100 [Bdellovibrionaceae bacterium]|nr:hypothetical protein [Pseudobdellovibrionaceae bacterium]|tara:strand:- start:1307 stop:1696 length:390 start_codon:yes stop_codon:yes gene_type:complete